MFRLATPSEFIQSVSNKSRLKFILTWLGFLSLVVPTAFVMLLGVSEKYALPLMLLAILPVYYVLFCLLTSVDYAPHPVVAHDNLSLPPTVYDISDLATLIAAKWSNPPEAKLGPAILMLDRLSNEWFTSQRIGQIPTNANAKFLGLQEAIKYSKTAGLGVPIAPQIGILKTNPHDEMIKRQRQVLDSQKHLGNFDGRTLSLLPG